MKVRVQHLGKVSTIVLIKDKMCDEAEKLEYKNLKPGR